MEISGNFFLVAEIRRDLVGGELPRMGGVEVFTDREEALKEASRMATGLYPGEIDDAKEAEIEEALRSENYFGWVDDMGISHIPRVEQAVQIVKTDAIDIRFSSVGYKPQRGG